MNTNRRKRSLPLAALAPAPTPDNTTHDNTTHDNTTHDNTQARRPVIPRLRRRLLTAALLACALGLSSLAGSVSAYASSFTVAYTGGGGVALRNAPTATARITPLIVWADGHPVTITCQAWSSDGSAVGPRANRIFDQIANSGRSTPTWVPDSYVAGTAAANTFTAGIPRCGAAPSPSTSAQGAVNWAGARLGQSMYSGWCLLFVHDAYLYGGGKDIGGASTAYAFWQAHPFGRHYDTTPPPGALVFWGPTTYNSAGHVALSTGGGQTISSGERSYYTIHTMTIAYRNAAGYPYLGYLIP